LVLRGTFFQTTYPDFAQRLLAELAVATKALITRFQFNSVKVNPSLQGVKSENLFQYVHAETIDNTTEVEVYIVPGVGETTEAIKSNLEAQIAALGSILRQGEICQYLVYGGPIVSPVAIDGAQRCDNGKYIDPLRGESCPKKKESSSSNIGLIIGIIVGLIFIAVIAFVIWKCCYKRPRQARDLEQLKDVEMQRMESEPMVGEDEETLPPLERDEELTLADN